MLGERRVHVAAEASPHSDQLAKNARGAPDGRFDRLAAALRRRRRGRRRRGGRRAEAALEVVAEGLPRPVVVLAVLLEVRLDVLRRELGRGRPRRRAAREEALDDLGRALAQAELEDGVAESVHVHDGREDSVADKYPSKQVKRAKSIRSKCRPY